MTGEKEKGKISKQNEERKTGEQKRENTKITSRAGSTGVKINENEEAKENNHDEGERERTKIER